jgi:hypothetical protein
MKQLLSLALVAILIVACTRDDGDEVSLDLGYGYFPVEIGHYVVYRADSIWHDNPTQDAPGVHDTTSYFIKELIESDFTDGAGETAQRLERFKRFSQDDPWDLVDVWFIKRTSLNAQKIEENVRYIKMGFPIENSSTWDGNALNNNESRTYQFDSLYVVRTFGELTFPETVKVLQLDNFNFVEDQLAFEIYAPEVGLVRRYFRDLTTRLDYSENPVAENIRSGVEFNWEIIEFGME